MILRTPKPLPKPKPKEKDAADAKAGAAKEKAVEATAAPKAETADEAQEPSGKQAKDD